ncbi:hypothetical protein LTR72_003931 [Exophiala xenobiotica]|uniref:Transcription factor domain-containing protein n=1 Tax=Vermiconidia calcicola TaxID=1690605 RepID=A0AAV9QGM9_9PEZI|nr:hypothetical protein LTR72_003931 [Exophiala xenobiotica]KAK5542468.1 hypothetical protein LTR25_002354 [Vermiconidia calcicola]KAK5546326.1 hypothetical protein LTR23_003778 [Chaetothyriales sp. CCFEE 6169]KAK5298848.1 hypothetical protein LTR14_002700 [Exophiala xenobiotica]KAK5424913.1 hypothetical protein LTR90_000504 [Exophiala xenobiotica]
MNYWVENFVFGFNDIPEIGHEYTSCVLPCRDRAHPGSALRLALSALAHAVFGRTRRVDKALKDTNMLYSQAITRMEAEVKGVAAEDTDELLITMILMGSFQFRRGRFSALGECLSSQGSLRHVGATAAKVKISEYISLDRVIRRQLIFQIRIIILRGRTIPYWLEDPEYEEEGPMRELDSLMLRLANL